MRTTTGVNIPDYWNKNRSKVNVFYKSWIKKQTTSTLRKVLADKNVGISFRDSVRQDIYRRGSAVKKKTQSRNRGFFG